MQTGAGFFQPGVIWCLMQPGRHPI